MGVLGASIRRSVVKTTEAELIEAMNQVWNDTSDPPELIYLPGVGVRKIDSDEARAYFREMMRVPEADGETHG